MSAESEIPRFAVFGEPLPADDPEFIHIETISARSRLYDWTITAHTHHRLFQLVYVDGGSGVVRLDSKTVDFTAACAVSLPSGTVHAFSFEPGTSGHVITVSDLVVADAGRQRGRGSLQNLLRQPQVIDFAEYPAGSRRLETAITEMDREFKGNLPGRHEVFACFLRIILMTLGRQLELQGPGRRQRGMHPDDFNRFRATLEEHFCEHWSVPDYARALAVSPTKLNRLCRLFAGKAALDVIHDRLILEAERLLLFSSVSSATIAYELGFKDPAYFSRFFKKRTGKSPLQFRESRRRND